MNDKPKPPPSRPAKAGLPAGKNDVPNPLRQPAARWQRTVRYGWDQGRAGGGRRGGR